MKHTILRVLRVSCVVAGALLAAGFQEAEVVWEYWAEEKPRTMTTVRRTAAGEPVAHGEFQRWHSSGELAEEGEYTDGLRSGKWTLRWEDGRRRAQGPYKGGKRHGSWKFWKEGGGLVASGRYVSGWRSGKWKLTASGAPPGELVTRTASGGWSFGGATDRGTWNGLWLHRWPSGRKMYVGAFSAGQATGDHAFFHEDGTFEPEWFSGRYENSTWAGPVEVIPDDDSLNRMHQLALGEEDPGPQPFEVDPALVASLAAFEAGAEDARSRLLAGGKATIPVVLNRLMGLDIALADDATLARRLHVQLLTPVCGGHVWPWADGDDARALAANRLTLARWRSFWSLFGQGDYWDGELDDRFHWVPIQLADTVLARPPRPYEFLAGSDDPAPAARETRLQANETAAIASGLAWLASKQMPNGGWEPIDARAARYNAEIACNSLALSAFLEAGDTPARGNHVEKVHAAVRWLVKHMDHKSGMVKKRARRDAPDLLYQHALATEAFGLLERREPLPAARRLGEKAREALLEHQLDDGSWPRHPDEQRGDVTTTVTAFLALHPFRDQRSQANLDRALSWLQQLWRADSGVISSTGAVQFPFLIAEHELTLTAMGGTVFAQVGVDRSFLDKTVRVVLERMPAAGVSEERLEPSYLCFGARLVWSLRESALGPWRQGAVAWATKTQNEDGSWDPIGPSAHGGGRVFSTSLMLLALQAGRSYPE